MLEMGGNMRRQRKHSKLFYQYLTSYLLLLFVPLLILTLFLYGYVLGTLKEEIYINNIETLNKAKGTIEAQLQLITSDEHKLYLKNNLAGFRLEGNTVRAIETQRELKRYLQMNPFLVDIAYYQEMDEYIVTAKSSCKKEFFWNKMYQFEEWSYEDFLQDLRENKSFFFLEAQRVEEIDGSVNELISLVVPLSGSKKCVILLLDSAFFTDVMPEDATTEGISMITYESGKILVAKGNEALIEAIYSDELTANPEVNEIKIQGKTYLRSCVYSERYSWNYETLIPMEIIEEKIVYIKWMIWLICICISAAGLMGIYYFLKQNYSPIQKLELTTNAILENTGRNEIEHIKAVIEYLNNQNQKLREDEENRMAVLKERFILRWINGHYIEEQECMKMAQAVGILLSKPLYQVGIIHMPNWTNRYNPEVEDILMKNKPIDMELYVVWQAVRKSAYIVAGYYESQKDIARTFFSDIPMLLENNLEQNVVVGVGEFIDKELKVQKSYEEAVKALEYRIVLSNQKVIRFHETLRLDNCKIEIRPQMLSNYIRKKDTESLESFLENSLKEVRDKKPDIRQVRMLCSDFVYALEKAIDEVNRDFFVEQPLDYGIIENLQYDTFEELLCIIRIIGCDLIGHMEALSNTSLIADILNYVKEYFSQAEFSVASMAEEFKMSVPYLSKYFKKHTNKNLSEYVTELKVEKAKELLLYTDISVVEVAEQVGYYNTNSFCRRFKQITGVAPGEWRNTRKGKGYGK